jgi:hypothetical protein
LGRIETTMLSSYSKFESNSLVSICLLLPPQATQPAGLF